MKNKVHTSASRISTYKQCPKKYYYRYIKQLPVYDFWSHLIMGNFTHSVLEGWVSRLMKGEDPKEAMRAAYKDAVLSGEYEGKIERFLKEVRPWLQRAVLDYETNQFMPLCAEEKVSFRYRHIEVTGRIDRIDGIGPDRVKIVDYKTVKNPDFLTTMQLGIYHIGVKYGSLKDQYGNKEIDTAYVLIRHDMKEVSFQFTKEQLEAVLTDIEEVTEQIESDTEWKSCSSPLCQYCDFFVPCTQERNCCDWFDDDILKEI